MTKADCKHEKSVWHGNVLWCPECESYYDDKISSDNSKVNATLLAEVERLREALTKIAEFNENINYATGWGLMKQIAKEALNKQG